MTGLDTSPRPAPDSGRYRTRTGTIEGIRAADFTLERIRAMRAHAVALRNSGLLLMMEQFAMDDAISRCDQLSALHSAADRPDADESASTPLASRART